MRSDGKPTNPRFAWSEEVRRLQREATEAVDRLNRAEIAEQHAEGEWDGRYEGKPGTVIDDLNESMITGFVGITQYQFMVGDPEDGMMLVVSSGNLTAATARGLVHELKLRYNL